MGLSSFSAPESFSRLCGSTHKRQRCGHLMQSWKRCGASSWSGQCMHWGLLSLSAIFLFMFLQVPATAQCLFNLHVQPFRMLESFLETILEYLTRTAGMRKSSFALKRFSMVRESEF